MNNGALHAPIAIVKPADNSSVKAKTYNAMNDLTADYDESTEVYKNAEAVSTADGYRAPIQVIEYPQGNSSESVNNVKSNDGSFKETSAQPSIVKTVEDNLDERNVFVIPTDEVPETDVEALADALYTDRGGAVAYQVKDVDVMKKFAAHIAKSQVGGDGNVLGMFEDRDLKPAAQVAAYMAVNAPVDLMKVGEMDQLVPTDLTADQVRDVLSSGFNVVENKSDMAMVATGKAVGGSYLDHFVNTKIIRDRMTFTTQTFMNTHEMPYTQATIDELKLACQSEANKLYKENFFINNQPVVSAISREDTPSSDVGTRTYRGISVKGDLFNSIEKFNGSLTIDE